MFLTLNLVMLKDFLIKNKIRREKIKIKTISGLQAGPTGRRHDTAFVTARVWASPQAQHTGTTRPVLLPDRAWAVGGKA
jgi:hypothetical protein